LIILLATFIASGVFFMLVPGTLMGVWNLIEIGTRHSSSAAATPWIQAHGHAQLFGWIGTFILGIGFYSVPNLRKVCDSKFIVGWICLATWVTGVALRWLCVSSSFEWRMLLPLSALLELIAVVLFTWITVKGSRINKTAAKPLEAWSMLLISGTMLWLLVMSANLALSIQLAAKGAEPLIALEAGHKLLYAAVWGWVVPTVWGLSAKWLTVFLGLAPAKSRLLKLALILSLLGVTANTFSFSLAAQLLVLSSCISFVSGLRLFNAQVEQPRILGVHPSFPAYVKVAFAWLLISAGLFLASALSPGAAGLSGAARHAITVGFFSSMVFSVGPRILPAFLGRRKIFSEKLMFWGLSLLTIGCFLRVVSQILAYDFAIRICWTVLPISALIELSAISVFAFNMLATLFEKAIVDEILASA
ncbi:MAG: NnrS family protein, partial [Candidatus Obscuribacterales bacterium]|nr:NnrS family protein [Candidatus Obscuribacterales bacterium]